MEQITFGDIDPSAHLVTVRFMVSTRDAFSQSRTDKARTRELLDKSGGEDGSAAVVGKLFPTRQRHVAALLARLRAMRERVVQVTEPTTVPHVRLLRTNEFVSLDRDMDVMKDELRRRIADLNDRSNWSEVMAAARRFRGAAFDPSDYDGLPEGFRRIEVSMDVGQLPRSGMLVADLPGELLGKLNARYEKQRELDVKAAHRAQIKRAMSVVGTLAKHLDTSSRIHNSVIDAVRDTVDNSESRKFMRDSDFEEFNSVVASILRGIGNDTVKECKKSISTDLKSVVEKYGNVLGD